MTYTEVCEAKSKAEMVEKFRLLLKSCAKKFGGTPESHELMQLANVGYFSGYYNSATAKRVLKWLGAEHPIFGTAHANGYLSSSDALEIGKKLGSTHRE